MQFEIKVKILYAPPKEYCTVEDGLLRVGPLPKEHYDEPLDAMGYLYSQGSCLAKKEYVWTIYGSKLTHFSGIAPIDDIIALQDTPNIHVDWRGIRRGLEYQIYVYVYLVEDAYYQKCVEAVQSIFSKYDITIHECSHKEIDNTLTPIKENGCFDYPSPFIPEFIEFDKPQKKYHEFFRDADTRIHVFEKYTLNSKKVSWDKELHAEGDSSSLPSFLLSLLGIIIPLLQGRFTQAKIEKEKRFINRCMKKIAENYDVEGYLFTKKRFATNSKGKKVHIIQEKRGSKVLNEYEIQISNGKIRRYKCR